MPHPARDITRGRGRPYNARVCAVFAPHWFALVKKFVAALLLLVVAVVALSSFFALRERDSHPIEGLPWQIEPRADGTSRVFRLILGESTLADARERLGTDMDIALIAAPEEPGTIEAYYGQFTAGVITGRIVLAATLEPATIARMRERAPSAEYMESTTRKFTLHPADLPLAFSARITTITFLPSARIDEEIARTRFGAPAERVRTSEQVEHLLYPELGLDLVINDKGKDVLQYVAPREFARLRDPLIAARGEAGR